MILFLDKDPFKNVLFPLFDSLVTSLVAQEGHLQRILQILFDDFAENMGISLSRFPPPGCYDFVTIVEISSNTVGLKRGEKLLVLPREKLSSEWLGNISKFLNPNP